MEKNKIKLSTVILILIIFILLVCLGGMYYYYNYITCSNDLGTNNIIGNTVEEEKEEKSIEKEIIGTWEYYKAENDGEEIGLREIFGSSISSGTGSMKLNADKTFVNYRPGVMSIEQLTEGTYEVEKNNITLTYTDNSSVKLEYAEDDEEGFVIKCPYESYILYLRLEK